MERKVIDGQTAQQDFALTVTIKVNLREKRKAFDELLRMGRVAQSV